MKKHNQNLNKSAFKISHIKLIEFFQYRYRYRL